MATMIPDLAPRLIDNDGERRVYAAIVGRQPESAFPGERAGNPEEPQRMEGLRSESVLAVRFPTAALTGDAD